MIVEPLEQLSKPLLAQNLSALQLIGHVVFLAHCVLNDSPVVQVPGGPVAWYRGSDFRSRSFEYEVPEFLGYLLKALGRVSVYR